MATVLIAKNLTALPVGLPDIGITIPPLGQVTLTAGLRTNEVLGSPTLQTAVLDGQVVLNNGASDIPLSSSAAWFDGDVSVVPGVGSAVARSVYTAVRSSTSSPVFSDAMAGSFAKVPEDGDYFCFFEGYFAGTNNQQGEISLGVGSTTSPLATSTRVFQTFPRGVTVATSALVLSLISGAGVFALWRNAGSGKLDAIARRLTILRVET